MIVSTGLTETVLKFSHVDRLTMPWMNGCCWTRLTFPSIRVRLRAQGKCDTWCSPLLFTSGQKLPWVQCQHLHPDPYSQQLPSSQRFSAASVLGAPQQYTYHGDKTDAFTGTKNSCLHMDPQTSQSWSNCSSKPASYWYTSNNKILLWAKEHM